MSTIAIYKKSKTSTMRQALKGKAQNVAVVNTPTVKVDYSGNKPKPMPPTLRLTSDDLAAIKGWKVGGKYKLTIEVEQTSMRQGNDYFGDSEDSSSKDKVNATFKVTSVKAV